jgi:hypothetical protein
MAEYTTQIRSIVEQLNKDNDFEPSSTDPINAIDERIENARPHIFSFNYPILAADKARFEKNFIRHFYTREIGLETYSLWRLKLASKLNMIIPKYNKYFEEATKYVDVNLLDNVDYRIVRDFDGNKNLSNTEVVDGTRTDNLSETTNGTNNGEVTRTDNLTENTNDDGTESTTRTDNLTENTSDDGSENTLRTDNLSETNNRNGSETNNRDFVRAYSDTPQGNMQNLLDEKYLTNLTHEYENGSLRLNADNNTKANTGTVATDVDRNNERVKTNTGNVKTDTDKTNDRVKTNTGTVTTESEETNSSTKRNTGTVDTDTTTTRTGTERDVQEEDTHHVGKNGGMTYAEALLKARETYLNIDLMLCDELDDLFMQIW